MKFSLRMSLLVIGLTAVTANAADQAVNLEHLARLDIAIDSPVEEPAEFWERFKVTFDDRVDDQFAARFHPFTTMNWSVALEDGLPGERAADTARRALSKSALHGAREAAVDLPLMLWLEDRQGFLADLLSNSVGSTREEEVKPLDVSYRPVERSWWKRVSEGGDIRYGLRPFRTNPYAYLSFGLNDGERQLLLGHVRYHYRSFAEHRFEFALSLPIAHGFALDFGTSYRFGHGEDEERLVVKLFKEFKSGGILHVGFEAREGAALFAGLSVPW